MFAIMLLIENNNAPAVDSPTPESVVIEALKSCIVNIATAVMNIS